MQPTVPRSGFKNTGFSWTGLFCQEHNPGGYVSTYSSCGDNCATREDSQYDKGGVIEQCHIGVKRPLQIEVIQVINHQMLYVT